MPSRHSSTILDALECYPEERKYLRIIIFLRIGGIHRDAGLPTVLKDYIRIEQVVCEWELKGEFFFKTFQQYGYTTR